MSTAATGSGDDDRKWKEAPEKLLGIKSDKKWKRDAIGAAKKEEGVAATDIVKKEEAVVKKEEGVEEGVAATGVYIVKKEEAFNEEETEFFRPFVVVLKDGSAHMLFTELRVKELGVPVLEEFAVQSLDNRSYVGIMRWVDRRTRICHLDGTIREAIQDSAERRKAILFRKSGNTVICKW